MYAESFNPHSDSYPRFLYSHPSPLFPLKIISSLLPFLFGKSSGRGGWGGRNWTTLRGMFREGLSEVEMFKLIPEGWERTSQACGLGDRANRTWGAESNWGSECTWWGQRGPGHLVGHVRILPNCLGVPGFMLKGKTKPRQVPGWEGQSQKTEGEAAPQGLDGGWWVPLELPLSGVRTSTEEFGGGTQLSPQPCQIDWHWSSAFFSCFYFSLLESQEPERQNWEPRESSPWHSEDNSLNLIASPRWIETAWTGAPHFPLLEPECL